MLRSWLTGGLVQGWSRSDAALFIFMAATLGVYALGAAIEGHMEYPLDWPLRILTAVSGVALMWPTTPPLSAVGAPVVITILGLSIKTDRVRQAALAETGLRTGNAQSQSVALGAR
jgi:TRAP-type uncharacterized transport system fused permease subunit